MFRVNIIDVYIENLNFVEQESMTCQVTFHSAIRNIQYNIIAFLFRPESYITNLDIINAFIYIYNNLIGCFRYQFKERTWGNTRVSKRYLFLIHYCRYQGHIKIMYATRWDLFC